MPEVTKPVLVVGASGFVGRHLVRRLLAEGRTVRCLARDVTRIHDLADAGGEVVEGDVLSPASMVRAGFRPGGLHLHPHPVAQRSNAAGQDFMDVELTGLQNIVDGCRAAGVRRLVYVTSIGVAPDAPSAWVRGRAQTEQLLFTSGLDVSVLRPGMIVGRGGTGFDAIIRGARGPAAVVLGSGQQKFRTIAVDDLVHYLADVLDDPRCFGHHYDVGSDDVLTSGQMIDIAAERLGRRRPVKIRIPARLLGLAAPLIERLTKLPRGAIKGLADSLQVDMTGDPRAIRAIVPRPPQTYRQALEHALS